MVLRCNPNGLDLRGLLHGTWPKWLFRGPLRVEGGSSPGLPSTACK